MPTDARLDDFAMLLSNTYALQIKTHVYHWNVTGPEFFSLHTAFEEQYRALFEAADEIAERLRAIGGRPQLALAGDNLVIAPGNAQTTAKDMVEGLWRDHQRIAALIKPMIPRAQAQDDEASADLLIERCQAHEKTAWMLGAFLQSR